MLRAPTTLFAVHVDLASQDAVDALGRRRPALVLSASSKKAYGAVPAATARKSCSTWTIASSLKVMCV